MTNVITLTFGAYNLQSAYCTVTGFTLLSSPESEAQVASLAHSDGGVLIQRLLKPRSFTVSGVLKADTQALLLSRIDELKANTLALDSMLMTYSPDGVTFRSILAVCTNAAISNDQFYTTAAFTLTFVAPAGVSLDATIRTFANWTQTASSQVQTASFLGSSTALPSFAIGINSLTGGATNSIALINNSTLNGITVVAAYSAGQTLYIDSVAQSVDIDGVAVDFSGQFPEWYPGAAASIKLTDNFSARNMTVTSTYNARYL